MLAVEPGSRTSFETIQDTNISSEVAMLLADSRDRLEGVAFAARTGVTQPTGVVPAPILPKDGRAMPDPFHDAIMEFIASVAAVRAAGQDLAATDAVKAAAEALPLLAAAGDETPPATVL